MLAMSANKKPKRLPTNFTCDICGPLAVFGTQQALLVHKKSQGHRTRHKVAIQQSQAAGSAQKGDLIILQAVWKQDHVRSMRCTAHGHM